MGQETQGMICSNLYFGLMNQKLRFSVEVNLEKWWHAEERRGIKVCSSQAEHTFK